MFISDSCCGIAKYFKIFLTTFSRHNVVALGGGGGTAIIFASKRLYWQSTKVIFFKKKLHTSFSEGSRVKYEFTTF